MYLLLSKQDALPAVLLLLFLIAPARAAPLIIDHTATELAALPRTAIDQVKQNLPIMYYHTSHGSQLTTGMTGLVSFTPEGDWRDAGPVGRGGPE